MADEKKKPSLALVIGVSKGKPKATDDDDDEAEESGDFDAAADELWDAIESKDAKAFKQALKAVKSC